MKIHHRFRLLFLLFFSAAALIPSRSEASHAVAADLTYQYLSPNTYKVTFRFYRDCYGIPAPTTVDINYTSSCNAGGYVTLNPIPGTGQAIQHDCITGATTCDSPPGTAIGVQEWIYEGTVILPVACADWVLSYTTCCRNVACTNLANASGVGIYVSSLLNNIVAPTNSSPVFANIPVPQFCVGNQFYYFQGATDIDGDSLTYSLVAAQDAGPVNLAYVSPYTPLQPFSTTSGVTINSQTGMIQFTPNLQMVAVVCVLVNEYRNSIQIGSVKRDMQIIIANNCAPIVPTYSEDPVTHITYPISIHCGDSSFIIGLTHDIQCGSISPDGTDFRISDPTGQAFPIQLVSPVNCLTGLTDSIYFEAWVPFTMNGVYWLYTKLGNDQNTLLSECGNPVNEFDSLRLEVWGCYDHAPDLVNVTVNMDDSTGVTWKVPDSLLAAIYVGLFSEYQLFKSLNPWGPYSQLASTYLPTDTTFNDTAVNVHTTAYNYQVRLVLNNGVVTHFSDSIQSILLTGVFSPDSSTIALSWTPYWGWANPKYYIRKARAGTQNWSIVDSTYANSYIYTISTIPADSGYWKLEIMTENYGTPLLVSESNWIYFTIEYPIQPVLLTNVFTPNDDAFNGTFVVKNLIDHPNSRIVIFNRWGRKVYENPNYDNSWTAAKESAGVYYYILYLNDGTDFHGTVTVLK